VIVVAIVVVAGAVAVVRPSLADKESTVDERWEPVGEVLISRYDELSLLANAIDDASDSTRDVVSETREALGAWAEVVDGDQAVEEQVEVANTLEGLAARLQASVLSSSRLAADPAVVGQLEALDATVVPVGLVETYNEAVRDYDDERGSLLARPVAGAFGFGARSAFAPVGGTEG